MSRGPGKIERSLDALFRDNPSDHFTTTELVERIFPGVNRVEKKHRVTVMRAGYKVAKRMHWTCSRQRRPGGEIVFFNLCDLRSYAVGRMRVIYCATRAAANAVWNDEANRMWRSWQPGGSWDRQVRINRLRRDGPAEEYEAAAKDYDEKEGKILRAMGYRYSPMLQVESPEAEQ